MFKQPSKRMNIIFVATVFFIGAAAQADEGMPGTYPETRQVLAELVASGQSALAHYHRSELQARKENQPYIADLFKAMAVSQAVMNRNFAGQLNDLGGRSATCAAPAQERPTTRQNLITAIRNEIRETDKIYPEALARIAREGQPAAVALLKQVLHAQQLRRRDMREIFMGARYFYTRLQKEVRRRATVYYICQQSGTLLLNDLPAICPVRGAATSSYRTLHGRQWGADLIACRSDADRQRL